MNKTLTVSKAGACLRLIKIVPPPNTEISNVLAISDLCSASFGGQVTVLRRPLHVA